MRNFLSIVTVVSLILFATPSALADSEAVIEAPAATEIQNLLPIWQPEHGDEISFKVLRKGKPFGYHQVKFNATGDNGFTATAEVELTAKLGPITLYSYRHDSVETWADERLIGLTAATRKEGNDIEARANGDESGLTVVGTNYEGTYPVDIVPANHWNVSQLYTNTMLSTEGGQPLDVVVENLGRETLEIAGTQIEATKIKLASDLTIFLWYDDDGRWLRLELTARGQLIEYVLEDLY